MLVKLLGKQRQLAQYCLDDFAELPNYQLITRMEIEACLPNSPHVTFQLKNTHLPKPQNVTFVAEEHQTH